jgi:hypothetical protein
VDIARISADPLRRAWISADPAGWDADIRPPLGISAHRSGYPPTARDSRRQLGIAADGSG